MHWSPPTAALVAMWLVVDTMPTAVAAPGRNDASSSIELARQQLARNDARGAVELLESALPESTGATRRALLEQLRAGYAAAAREATKAGRSTEAEAYRENLEILVRKLGPLPNDPEPDSSIPLIRDETPLRAKAPMPKTVEPAASPATPVRPPAPVPPRSAPADSFARQASDTKTGAGSTRESSIPTADPKTPSLDAADSAFVAGKYDDAGRIYAALDRTVGLTTDRRDHWAYCRAVAVVRRINAKPSTPEEWAAIDAEVARIRALSPNHWFTEYLRSRAADRGKGRPKDARPSSKVVIRGASPEDPAPLTDTSAQPPVESANFRVFHSDRGVGERVARAAEIAREIQVRRWTGASPNANWSPRCEIHVYPSADVFSRETGQTAESPGFSTMSLSEGRVVARRINLRADEPKLVHAILPHEVTHVVMADLFPNQKIPRWADEGMAVLAEPLSVQALRAADLDEPLGSGRVFRLGELTTMDYPETKHLGLFFSQSVSVTRFLVESGKPEQFITFLREAQRVGYEPALQSVYRIVDFSELERRWLAHLRDSSGAALAASAADGEQAPRAPRR